MAGEVVRIGVQFDPSQVDRGVRTAEGSLGRLVGAAKAAGLAIASFIGARQIISGFSAIVREGKEAELSQARLGAVIRATGGAAGVSAREIDALADAMARTTLFLDEPIRDAASALLAFRNITRPVFEDALRLSADLAAMWNEDITSAAFRLGRALADPERGIRLLRQSGVALTTEEMRLVDAALRANDVLSAQRTILDAVTRSVGGTGAAAATGLAGGLHAVKREWLDLLEVMGRTETVTETMGFYTAFFASVIAGWREIIQGPGLEVQLDRAQTRVENLQRMLRSFSLGPLGDAARREALREAVAEVERLQALQRVLARPPAPPARPGVIEDPAEATRRAAEAARAVQERADLLARMHEADLRKGMALGEEAADRARRAGVKEAERLRERARLEAELRAVVEDRVRSAADEVEQLRWHATILEDIRDERAGLKGEDMEHARALRVEAVLLRQRQSAEEREMELRRLQAQEALESAEFVRQAMRNSQDAMADFFDQALAGNLSSFQAFAQAIVRVWRQMIAQMLAAQAGAALWRALGSIIPGIPVGERVFVPPAPDVPAPVIIPFKGSSVSAQPVVVHQNVTFAVSAIDQRGVADFFVQNRGFVMKAVADGVKQSRGFAAALGG